MPIVSYVVEYDENSCAWLADVNRPSFRIALEHGMLVQMVPACSDCDALPCVCGPAGQMRHVHFAPDTPSPIAHLDKQGLMFTKITIGDETLLSPWLPKPGGRP